MGWCSGATHCSRQLAFLLKSPCSMVFYLAAVLHVHLSSPLASSPLWRLPICGTLHCTFSLLIDLSLKGDHRSKVIQRESLPVRAPRFASKRQTNGFGCLQRRRPHTCQVSRHAFICMALTRVDVSESSAPTCARLALPVLLTFGCS